ncbi:hypothetical protein [Pararhizobium haloflavum]|uniref:hypothetical protein n=1 Tax=Pararhizobium haloflavum TaxID=2037914 RepID=UPI0012FFF042|nr:hypothetical protein [Pararhizobium haloflavum]
MAQLLGTRPATGGKAMTHSIADYLRDFGGEAAYADFEPAAEKPGIEVSLKREKAGEPDIASIEAAAYARGQAAGEAEAKAEQAAALAAMTARHGEEIDALRKTLTDEIAATLAARFDALSGSVVETLGRQTGAVIAPFLEEAMTERMIAALALDVSQAIGEGAAIRLAVSGPAELHARFVELFPDKAVSFAFTETDGADLCVDIDGTAFATRLADWSTALKEALA